MKFEKPRSVSGRARTADAVCARRPRGRQSASRSGDRRPTRRGLRRRAQVQFAIPRFRRRRATICLFVDERLKSGNSAVKKLSSSFLYFVFVCLPRCFPIQGVEPTSQQVHLTREMTGQGSQRLNISNAVSVAIGPSTECGVSSMCQAPC